MDRMDTDSKRIEMPTDALTEKVIGAAFSVQNELGNGFLEKVYENALTVEMTSSRGFRSNAKNHCRSPTGERLSATTSQTWWSTKRSWSNSKPCRTSIRFTWLNA